MNRNQIKMLAIAAMTIDHIALVFFASDSLLYYVMRLFGRITAPIMAFMLAEGFRYTRSRSWYLLRLVAFALISQPFYYRLAFDRAPNGWLDICLHWNVMFSLAVALLSLMILESDLPTVPRLILTGCCVSLAQFGDWSFMIPAWAIIFHIFQGNQFSGAGFFLIILLLESCLFIEMPPVSLRLRKKLHKSWDGKLCKHTTGFKKFSRWILLKSLKVPLLCMLRSHYTTQTVECQ